MEEKKEKKQPVKKVTKAVKKVFKKYTLKKAFKVGDTVKPIGDTIALTKDGYRFYKQKNIV